MLNWIKTRYIEMLYSWNSRFNELRLCFKILLNIATIICIILAILILLLIIATILVGLIIYLSDLLFTKVRDSDFTAKVLYKSRGD